jgi:hypothetical protein
MKEKLSQLRKFNTASFAVWPFEVADTSKLHANVVILGLNPSKDTEFGVNFHGKRFDVWYEEAFSRKPFAGAYMTDLISIGEPSAKVVIEKWKDDTFRQRHVDNLKQQFVILGVRTDTAIFCIGKNTGSLFKSVFPDFTNVYAVGHPNSYRMKNNKQVFLNDVSKIGALL